MAKSKIPALEKIIKKNPNSIVFARLAQSYLDEGDPDAALQICQEGLTLYPDYATAHIVMGRCYMASGDRDNSRRAFKKALRYDPQSLPALEGLADINRDEGSDRLVLSNLKRSLNLDPLDPNLKEEIAALSEAVEAQVSTIVTEIPPAPEEAPSNQVEVEEPVGAVPVPSGEAVDADDEMSAILSAAGISLDEEKEEIPEAETAVLEEETSEQEADVLETAGEPAEAAPETAEESGETPGDVLMELEEVESQVTQEEEPMPGVTDTVETPALEEGPQEEALADTETSVEDAPSVEVEGTEEEAPAETSEIEDFLGGMDTESRETEVEEEVPSVEAEEGVPAEAPEVEALLAGIDTESQAAEVEEDAPSVKAEEGGPAETSDVEDFLAGMDTESRETEVEDAPSVEAEEGVPAETSDVEDFLVGMGTELQETEVEEASSSKAEERGPDEAPDVEDFLAQIQAESQETEGEEEAPSSETPSIETEPAEDIASDVTETAQRPAIPEEEDSGDDYDEIATATLADVYADQGFFDEAIEIYEKLLEESPDDEEVKSKIEELKKKKADQEGQGE